MAGFDTLPMGLVPTDLRRTEHHGHPQSRATKTDPVGRPGAEATPSPTFDLPIVSNHNSTASLGWEGPPSKGEASSVDHLATVLAGLTINGAIGRISSPGDLVAQESGTVRGRLAKAARIARLRVGNRHPTRRP